MIDLPERLDDAGLTAMIDRRRVQVFGRDAILDTLPVLSGLPRVAELCDVKAEILIAAGGGMRIDSAKGWRADTMPACKLVAVATRPGSGAEANGIAVLDTAGAKSFKIGSAYRPDARYYNPASLDLLSDEDLLWCAGDAMTHAVEGFLSPMASETLRADLAGVIRRMLALGPGRDAEWFELSALASAGQAASSVGFVHGLAHILEAHAIQALGQRDTIGHARLCAAFLAPVLRYDLDRSDKAADHFTRHGLDPAAILSFADGLSGPALALDLPWGGMITEHWRSILRDPCTRTNVATVRPGALDEFLALLPVSNAP